MACTADADVLWRLEMGWDFAERPEHMSVEEFLKQELGALDVAVVHYSDGDVAYAAVPWQGEVSATICILADRTNAQLLLGDDLDDLQESFNLVYKLHHEVEWPFATACPERILNLLTPTDHEGAQGWRDECRAALRRGPAQVPS